MIYRKQRKNNAKKIEEKKLKYKNKDLEKL